MTKQTNEEKMFKKLAKSLSKTFGPPFLPKDFAQFSYNKENQSLVVVIGDRDAEIGFDGTVHGAGTCIGPASGWLVVNRSNTI